MFSQGECVGFSPTMCESEGVYVVQTVTAALRYIDPHYDTLQEASQSCGKEVVPVVPARWVQYFHQKRVYNDWQKKKLKCPRMDRTSSAAHARALFSLVQKPCLASPAWHTICKDIEVLANTLQGYSDHLEAANEKQQQRQAQN